MSEITMRSIMMKSRFTRSQVHSILQEAERSDDMTATCRRHNITLRDLHRWQRKFGVMSTLEAQRLRLLRDEEEGEWLKRMLAKRYRSRSKS